MTIQEIQRRTQQTSPYFFSDATMRLFGQRMNGWSITKDGNRYRISQKAKDFNGKYTMLTVRFYNPENNELELK